MDNIKQLKSGRCLVRTQAGFRKLVKQHLKDVGDDYSKVSDIIGYPKSYPSIVNIYYDHMRTNEHYATCVPIHEYLKNLEYNILEIKEEIEAVSND